MARTRRRTEVEGSPPELTSRERASLVVRSVSLATNVCKETAHQINDSQRWATRPARHQVGISPRWSTRPAGTLRGGHISGGLPRPAPLTSPGYLDQVQWDTLAPASLDDAT